MKDVEELKDLLRYAKDNIDFYSDLYSDLEVEEINSLDDFRRKAPEVDKEVLLDFYDEGSFDLDVEGVENGVLARPTSGTTSDMAIYYRLDEEIESHCRRFADAADHYFQGGENKDRVLVATTFSLLPILSRQFMEKGCLVTSGSPFDIERTAETFAKMECNALVCSPPVALKVSEHLKEMGYAGLEKYYFISSAMSPLTEERLREMYPDAEIMLQYGLAETGILMKQCENLKGKNHYHLFGEWAPFHYEFITEEGKEAQPGEIGKIVVTKFNEKTPLIRYSVGDLFEVRGKCECGERTYRFVSREQDKFKVKGVTVFKDEIEDALEPVKKFVKQYQVLIDEEKNPEEDLPRPKLVIRAELTQNSEDVKKEIASKFEENFEVAEDYNWQKGVEMGIFAPVEVEENVFKERKFRKIRDKRYEE